MRRFFVMLGIHIHDWTNWSDPKPFDEVYLQQIRTCRTCNKVNRRVFYSE